MVVYFYVGFYDVLGWSPPFAEQNLMASNRLMVFNELLFSFTHYQSINVSDRTDVSLNKGARCSSVVRAFAHGAMGRRIDP